MTPEQWQVVKTLFETAVERPPEERSAFLATATNDPEIRRELESLLGAHRDDAFVGEGGGLRAAVAAVSETGLAGRRIGAYRIIETIGEGGMGVVYRAARDDQTYDKQVAIKVIRAGMLSEAALRRFGQERQILASLEHSHIARLLDGGATDDGSPYFVMEYIEGAPIDVYCD